MTSEKWRTDIYEWVRSVFRKGMQVAIIRVDNALSKRMSGAALSTQMSMDKPRHSVQLFRIISSKSSLEFGRRILKVLYQFLLLYHVFTYIFVTQSKKIF